MCPPKGRRQEEDRKAQEQNGKREYSPPPESALLVCQKGLAGFRAISALRAVFWGVALQNACAGIAQAKQNKNLFSSAASLSKGIHFSSQVWNLSAIGGQITGAMVWGPLEEAAESLFPPCCSE